MTQTLDDVLAHYGVKGMKWGIRRSRSNRAPASPDASRAAAARSVIKKNKSTDPLSNAELKDLVTRMNLEQQYSNLTAQRKGFGATFASNILKNVGQQQATAVISERATGLRKKIT